MTGGAHLLKEGHELSMNLITLIKQQENRPSNEMNSFTDYFFIKTDNENSKWTRNMKTDIKITAQKEVLFR